MFGAVLTNDQRDVRLHQKTQICKVAPPVCVRRRGYAPGDWVPTLLVVQTGYMSTTATDGRCLRATPNAGHDSFAYRRIVMKRIYSSQNTLMVDHLRHVLDAEGIECVVRNRDLANLAGRVPHDQCFVELWVAHDTDLEAANRVIDRAFAGPADTRVWNCLACGEQVEKAFDQCWNCGAVKGEREAAKDFGGNAQRRVAGATA